MVYSKAKLKSNGDRSSPCLKPFLIENVRQIHAYPDSVIDFNQTYFSLALAVSCGYQNQREYIQDLPPNRTICLLVCKYLMHSLIVSPLLLKYFMNAEYMISS